MEIERYLPAIVTGLVVAPLGFYLKHRLQHIASKHDFGNVIEQLKKSTDAVESIKSQLSEKYWVKQQVWDTKRVAYEEILSCLFLVRKYLDRLVAYMVDYTECYVHLCTMSCDYDEEYQRSYEEYVQSEQKAFDLKYESESAKAERKELMENTKDSILNLETVFSIKSLYLAEEVKEIEELLSKLKHKIFDEKLAQDEDEGITDFYERVTEHHTMCRTLVSDLITLTKDLAVKDLKLEP